jgi:dTMP kinase
MILRNFIVFEGIDGTGTTTQIAELKSRYASLFGSRDIPVSFTCEPTSGEIGKCIRRALRGELQFTPETMARLFAADRGEHLFGKGGIKEDIDSGKAVYSDRYIFSSYAYQGEAVQSELPLLLNRDYPLPEYLFFFDIESNMSMDRVEKREGTLEIYEKRDFQKKVRNRYLDIIEQFEKSEPDMHVIRIDASQDVGTIAEKIWSIAKNLPKI